MRGGNLFYSCEVGEETLATVAELMAQHTVALAVGLSPREALGGIQRRSRCIHWTQGPIRSDGAPDSMGESMPAVWTVYGKTFCPCVAREETIGRVDGRGAS